jgi:cytochrome c553
MKRSTKIISTAFLLLSSAMPLGASAQPPVDRALAANCFQCHGTDGRAVNGMPSIAGKDADSLFKRTREYQRSDKLNDIMVRQAKGYTDAQISQIAEYFAGVPEHLNPQSTGED